MQVHGMILAAGLGRRMHSTRPKVLHEVGGRPMVALVRDTLWEAGVAGVVAVVAPNAPEVAQALGDQVQLAYQHEQLGTGHAALQGLASLEGLSEKPDAVIVTYGDTPLLQPETLASLIQEHRAAAARGEPVECTMLTTIAEDPTGYGRVVRDDTGAVAGIVEQADCSPLQAAIDEINPGIYLVDLGSLRRHLPRLDRRNRQGEYYLTDLIGLIVAGGGRVNTVEADPLEVMGINSRLQLAEANEVLRWRELERVMAGGVTIVDPAATYIAPGVRVGQDTVIWPGTYLLGDTRVAAGSTIGPGAYVVDSTVGAGSRVWLSVVEGSVIGEQCSVGPYAHLRPETNLGPQVKVGNFAELKNSVVGEGTKVPHHSYVGDADIGEGVNVGAGAVFVNYDGRHKHRTRVESGAFIGCNVNLVAPLTVGRRGYVACGSSVTEDVPPGALAVARERQRNVEGWVERRLGPSPERGANEAQHRGLRPEDRSGPLPK